jgi:UPF0755 protein
MAKKVSIKLFLSVIILLIFAGVVMGVVVHYINSSPDIIKVKNSYFTISKGENLTSISDRLEQSGYIRSSLFMRIVSRLFNTEKEFMAGYYKIKQHATTIEIHNNFVAGNQTYVKMTIPEGWTKTKIAQYFEDLGVSSKEDILAAISSKNLLAKYNIKAANLEGYLFPDTYYFSEHFPPEMIIDKLVSTFFKNLGEIDPDYAKLDTKLLHDRVILASIIEREYRVKDEAQVIASVFYNRLKARVGLESCATIEYILTEIYGLPHPTHITIDMKSIDSLYNTYKWNGLPPGPISNPGKVALHASLFPAKTDYWFFLLKNQATGEHYFSKDLEEHNEAKFYYLKGVGEPPKQQ